MDHPLGSGQMRLAAALRDFFYAPDAKDRAEAYARMVASSPPAPAETFPVPQAEYAFNRLFIGPAAPAAPLYASVYLESDPILMGESTGEVRALYAALGLEGPQADSLPADHISLELDLLLCLDQALNLSFDPQIAAIYDRFLNGHMRVWVPRFIQRVNAASDVPPCIARVTAALTALIESLPSRSLQRAHAHTGKHPESPGTSGKVLPARALPG